jgi:hypothetical protein
MPNNFYEIDPSSDMSGLPSYCSNGTAHLYVIQKYVHRGAAQKGKQDTFFTH